MEQTRTIIGVDLGGTNMRAGLVVGDKILEVSSCLVPKTDNAPDVTQALIKTIRDVITPEVEGIGIGVPSLVKSSNGVVYDVQNIPSWKKIPLKDILEKEFKLPVCINNDANCFAVGERVYGAGQEYDDFVGLITGTGVGGGIIKNGHLLPDQNCGAGEFGMIPYLEHDYEYYCSGQFFENKYNVSGNKLAQKASEGDEEALSVFAEYGTHLGKVIKTILFSVDPKAIVLGGSVSRSFEYYKTAMWKEIATFPYQFVLENFVIVPSVVKEIAILGAAALYIDAVGED
ncbi:ROK family protein [Carboxylicivirga mesophila]|uniref:ROK family protein n=1 Tax=Carboxylicivirga mesophila TaxID=1166478 RepID=A0ABS5K7K5_9BACT|nr:ROK family protein [Carboxylicivirga mesophila]MBS2210872.1 ROK family protein [Carboxylicivirga mesophila]